MKINGNSVKQAATAQVNAKDLEKNLSAKDKKDISSSSLMGSAEVKMSPEAQAFQKAKAIASDSSIDEAKVSRLQKLIDEGKYRVDAAAVSDRLVDEQLLAGD